MIIGIYNLEPQYINIALEKIRLWHEIQGDVVEDYIPLNVDKYDKIYCSSIFTWTPKSYITDYMICGGSGFDLETKLPKEVENMKPKINVGFTTRGCFRNCPFCIVPQKEGKLQVTGDIYDFWNRENKHITLLDNNILGVKKHFKKICKQINGECLKADFNQGLDARLIEEEDIKYFINVKPLRFAWDDMKDEKRITETLEMLRDNNIKGSMWYILTGFNTDIYEDYYRVMKIRFYEQAPFVMLYNNSGNRDFARWVNHKAIFKSVRWTDYGNN